ncbi:hypothetical protein D9V84_11285, partial [Bacteroidetes/Chlorobi group bacterium Naka2016]
MWDVLMARNILLKFLRTTKSNLDSQKTAGNLIEGEPYFITDEQRLAIGTATNNYVELAKKSEVGGEAVNIENLTADKYLTASDAPIQMYTCSAERYIYLPMTGLSLGQKFVIWNLNASSSSVILRVFQQSIERGYITSGTKYEFRWDGTNWIAEWSDNIAIGYSSFGNYNFGIGIGNSASNNYTHGIGIGSNANSNYSYGVGIGFNATLNLNYAVGLGAYSTSNQKGAGTIAIGAFSRAERNREIVSTANTSTTNKAQMTIQKFVEKDLSSNGDAWQELFIDGSGARLVIIPSSVYHFLIQINAIDKVNFAVKTWKIEGAIKRDNANNTTLVGSTTTVTSA